MLLPDRCFTFGEFLLGDFFSFSLGFRVLIHLVDVFKLLALLLFPELIRQCATMRTPFVLHIEVAFFASFDVVHEPLFRTVVVLTQVVMELKTGRSQFQDDRGCLQ